MGIILQGSKVTNVSAAFTNIGPSGAAGPGGMNTSTGGGGAAAIVIRWSASLAAAGEYPCFAADGGSRRLRRRLLGTDTPKDDASSFCLEGRFTRAALLRACVKVLLY